jgi:hypothetical protein
LIAGSWQLAQRDPNSCSPSANEGEACAKDGAAVTTVAVAIAAIAASAVRLILTMNRPPAAPTHSGARLGEHCDVFCRRTTTGTSRNDLVIG